MPLKIAHLSSELAPLAKVGGLGDVVGALSAEQSRRGHSVVVVLPGYGAHGIPASVVVKFLSSLVTIGSGGSIGREGGIVQLSATLAGTTTGTWLNFSVDAQGPGILPDWESWVYRDDEALLWSMNVGSGNAPAVWSLNNQGPLSIAGGRHTLMLVADLSSMVKGWFVGNFTPSVLRTESAEVADTFTTRLAGLLGRSGLEPGQGLVLTKTGSVPMSDSLVE